MRGEIIVISIYIYIFFYLMTESYLNCKPYAHPINLNVNKNYSRKDEG